MRKASCEAGNDSVWVSYLAEAHGFGSVKDKIEFAQRLVAFLAKHLAPAQP